MKVLINSETLKMNLLYKTTLAIKKSHITHKTKKRRGINNKLYQLLRYYNNFSLIQISWCNTETMQGEDTRKQSSVSWNPTLAIETPSLSETVQRSVAEPGNA